MSMGFTPAELAEMARADAEIEATFRLTNEDVMLGRMIDRASILDNMDAAHWRRAEAQRRYREANRDKIAEGQRRYYEANRDKIAEGQRRYREANRDKIAEGKRRYYEANRDKIAEGKRELRDYRLSLGLTQKSFAALLGVSQPSICYWETISPPKDWKEIIKNTTTMQRNDM